jgi:CubicO group peptidase (beta-lactamase class C family)
MTPTREDWMKFRIAAVAVSLLAFAGPAHAGPVPRAQVDAAIKEIETMADDLIAAGAVPGFAIGVVHDDEVVWTKGFGVRRVGAPDPVDADTVFQLASMSKPISSTVIAALVGKGIVGWDDRIVEHDPGFALHDPYPTTEVTIRDMLDHRSGLPGSAGNDLETIGFDRDTIMHRLRLVPPWVSFRGGYSYSNAAFTEGGLAVAKAAGKDWESVAEEELFAPLGMVSTSFRYSDFRDRKDAAALHVRWQGAWTPLVTRDATAQAPAGGASSSVNDMTRWMRMELASGDFGGVSVIPADALAPTRMPQSARGKNPITGSESFYGIGWALEIGRHGTIWAHAGAFSNGALTVVKLAPESGLGIVILSNGFPNPAPDGIADSFLDLAIDGKLKQDYLEPWAVYYGRMFEPDIAAAKARFATPPDPANPALPATAYAGRYHNAYVGDAVVEAGAEGALTLRLGPDGMERLAMTHFDRDTFTYFPDVEMPDRPSAIRFAIGDDGRAETVTLESLDGNGLGTLARADQDMP